MRPTRFTCTLIVLIVAATVGGVRAQEPSFTAFYGPFSSPEYEELFGDLSSSQILEDFAALLNDAFSLPEPIIV